jgi:uncharacterized protein YdaT
MSDRKKYHVTQRPDGQWQAKGEGASRASAVTRTKAEAVDRARDLAKAQPLGQVIIHKSDGTIQSERTYGNDPYPPKG